MSGPVMVGVDGSDGSRAALRWASDLAERTGRSTVVVHAWRFPMPVGIHPMPVAPPDPDEMDARIEDSIRQICEQELGAAAAQVRIASLHGDATGALVDAARRDDADLLVVGSRGLGGFRSLLLGSVGRTVLEHAPCPVAIVRDETPLGGAAPIMVGVDRSDAAGGVVAWAAATAPALEAEILLVHAYRPGQSELPPRIADELRSAAQAALDRAAGSVEDAGVPVRAEMVDGDPREVLIEIAERERPRILVTGTRSTGGLAGVLLGSVATYLAQHVPGVLVVVPP
jgi:nucleotide-binding universal stress UspA family protein